VQLSIKHFVCISCISTHATCPAHLILMQPVLAVAFQFPLSEIQTFSQPPVLKHHQSVPLVQSEDLTACIYKTGGKM
jgi:hypothetical protein